MVQFRELWYLLVQVPLFHRLGENLLQADPTSGVTDGSKTAAAAKVMAWRYIGTNCLLIVALPAEPLMSRKKTRVGFREKISGIGFSCISTGYI